MASGRSAVRAGMAFGSGFALALMAAVLTSPWPGALLIRAIFDRDSARVRRALQQHVPPGVATISGERYRPGDRDALLDIHVPQAIGRGRRLPTIVWIHGGAWLSGRRTDMEPYFRILASHGFAVAAVDYSIAPAGRYPTPVVQVNAALGHLLANDDRLHVDPERIVLAGDSAGAQIASQVAALTTDQAYARGLGITPALRPDQLRGVALFCGFYNMRIFVERGRHAPIPSLRWGIGTMVRAYTGGPGHDPATLHQMSTFDHVTAAFPPTFLSGGNADPLTDAHSRPMAVRLHDLGVDMETLFFEAGHEPALGHEYQFDLDNVDGRTALDRLVGFARDHTRDE